MAATDPNAPDSAGSLANDPGLCATILNSIDQGFCVIEVLFDAAGKPCDYRFLETNAAFAKLTGLESAVGRQMRELAPAHEQHWFEIYGEVALTGEPKRFVQEARALEERWYDVYAFRLGAAELRRVALLFTDITERVRSERAARMLSEVSEALITLKREEELPGIIRAKAHAFLNLSQCALAELNLERRVATINPSWDQPDAPAVAGTHRFEDFVSAPLWQEVMQGHVVAINDTADSRIAGAERFHALNVRSFVTVPVRRRQEWRHVLILSRAEPRVWRPDEIETIRELAERCWNRVERLRAELAIQGSEERLRLILENAREYAIFSADFDRRITSWSEGAERLMGYSAAEIIGRSADEIFTPEDRAAGQPQGEADLALREGRASNERWHLRKDGTRFWGSGVMMAMRDDQGTVYGLLKIMRDQTNVRLAQEALLQSQTQLQNALEVAQKAREEAEAAGRAKDRFIATLSHELRTPLNPVLMISGERAQDQALPDSLREEFAMIQKNIEHEARLIDDMLDLSRIARGKVSLQEKDLDLNQIIREVLVIVNPAVAEKSIALSVKLGGEARVAAMRPA